SGGLDSRLIAAVCEAPPLCITMHSHPGYEVRTARRVADALGCEHQFVQLPPDYPLARVTDGALISDGMGSFHHAQFLYLADMLAERGTDLLLSGTYLELLFSDTLLPKRRMRALGRGLRLPVLAPEDHFDVARFVWRRRALDRVPRVRELVHGDRLDRVLGELQQRIAAGLPPSPDGTSDVYDFATFIYFSHSCLNRSNLNVQATERLVPAPILAFDTELIDLFFTIPPQHRLLHRLYAHIFTTIDRRCRWIPYSNYGVPLFNSALLEFVAASISRTLTRGLCAGLRRISKAHGESLARRAWPRVATAMKDCPEWHNYLRGRLASSRLVDMGGVCGDALHRLVEDQIAGTDNRWGLVGNWITLEEWLAHYG
ncbi:MAG: asparagine synthase-related protein, partial [Armatimonadota bacterium]